MAVLNFKDWQLRSGAGPAAAQLDHRSRQIAVTGDIPEGYSWDLLVMAPSGATDVWSLTAAGDGLAVVVTRGMVPEEGRYAVQLRGTLQSDNDTQRHTNIVQLRVLPSITAGGKWPVLPTEFSQAEARLRDIAAHPPIPDNGVWQLWNSDTGAYEDSELPLPSGVDGVTPHIGDNGNWYLGDEDTGVAAKGVKGDTGPQGPKGGDGAKGDTGPQGPKGDDGAKGDTGPSGADGVTPHIGDNGNWYLGSTDTGKPSRGATGAQGAKGDTGAAGLPGLVIGSTRPTAGNHPVWLDISGDEVDTEGLGITGATVGQIAKIAAVDASGKPTAWDPVDMPSWSAEKSWTKIIDASVTEATAEFKQDGLDNDTEFFIKWSNLQNATTTNSAQDLYINNVIVASAAINVNKSGATIYGWTWLKYNGRVWITTKSAGAISYRNTTFGGLNAPYNTVDGVGMATTIKFVTQNSIYAPITGKLEVWAR